MNENMVVSYQRTSFYESEELEDELVVMETNSQAITTLNPAGRLIWEAIEPATTLADLEHMVCQEMPGFDRRSLRDQIQTVLDTLIAAGLAVKSDQ